MIITATTPAADLASVPLYALAAAIRKDWRSVYFAAVPYLDAMRSLDTMSGSDGHDSARSIANYFLANAGTWRGPVAKLIKAELRRRIAN